MKLPIITLDEVYHVGSLDRYRRKLGRFEADALSVSWCPNTWSTLAECEDLMFWKLPKVSGAFLDIGEVKMPIQREILKWAERENLVERISIYRAHVEDAAGSSGYYQHRSKNLAKRDSSTVTKVRGWASTIKLDEARCLGGLDVMGWLAEDFAIMTFAEQSGLDGVWWKWQFSPDERIAPKGCVFPSRLDSWVENKIRLKSRDLDDKLMLKNFPKTNVIEISSNLLRTSIEISVQ